MKKILSALILLLPILIFGLGNPGGGPGPAYVYQNPYVLLSKYDTAQFMGVDTNISPGYVLTALNQYGWTAWQPASLSCAQCEEVRVCNYSNCTGLAGTDTIIYVVGGGSCPILSCAQENSFLINALTVANLLATQSVYITKNLTVDSIFCNYSSCGGGGGAAWLTTGNAGTNTVSNYIGTTDYAPVNLSSGFNPNSANVTSIQLQSYKSGFGGQSPQIQLQMEDSVNDGLSEIVLGGGESTIVQGNFSTSISTSLIIQSTPCSFTFSIDSFVNISPLIIYSGKSLFSVPLQIIDGTQANGKVLTSDANGNASWQTPGGGSVTLPAQRIAFGSGTNTITTDTGLTYNGSGLLTIGSPIQSGQIYMFGSPNLCAIAPGSLSQGTFILPEVTGGGLTPGAVLQVTDNTGNNAWQSQQTQAIDNYTITATDSTNGFLVDTLTWLYPIVDTTYAAIGSVLDHSVNTPQSPRFTMADIYNRSPTGCDFVVKINAAVRRNSVVTISAIAMHLP